MAIEGETFLFTSESVGEGHPDKICDQVSDAILDACLKVDPFSRVACETAAKTGMIMVLGEITTKANLDYQKIIRDTIKKIGYGKALLNCLCFWSSFLTFPPFAYRRLFQGIRLQDLQRSCRY